MEKTRKSSLARLQRQKNRYEQLTQEEREAYIQRSTNNRKRRIELTSSVSDNSNLRRRKTIHTNATTNQNDNIPRRYTYWLLKAQLLSYEHEGLIVYDPVCSTPHVLRNTPSCSHCEATRFQYEPPTFCCYKGKIKLAAITVPNQIHEFFTSNSEEAKEFRKNIRAYNSIFSFTSLGVKLDKQLASANRGIYTFRAQGQMYHDLPSLIPNENGPCFFQLYFYDTENELNNRMSKIGNSSLNVLTVERIMKILEGNPYAQFLRRLKDHNAIENLQLHIKKDVRIDQRNYNSPTADQVAAIWVEGNNSNIPFERDIVIHAKSGHRHNVKHYFSCYDPLQYPLLFPKGQLGWHQNIAKSDPTNSITTTTEQNTTTTPAFTSAEDMIHQEQQGVVPETDKKVTCREYYCYRFQIRESSPSILLLAGRLFQQYVVDMYIKLETTRLDYFRNNQANIRADLYQGIVDSVIAGETRGSEIGKRLVLPASFVGGPRDMRRRYLDAMALVQKFGKPDLFITMTCNPEWEEIKTQLKHGQQVQDRPDLTTRVFRTKLQDLKDQLFKKEIFGKVTAHVHVIEFQKRGLPHAHMLIILKPDYKIRTTDQFDRLVSAELPDKEKYPELFELVRKHMMHGPCGSLNMNNTCMVKEKCKNHYPRPFCEKTMLGKDGYPIYRRRDNKLTVKVRNAELDNRWVVPYNHYLLSRYNCHINVEICSSFTAVKYLYKYIYKGHDKVAVYISHSEGDKVIDEIKHFQDARWVSPQEALWRIYEFNLNEIYPAVINLPIHLPNQQPVTYWNNQNLENIINYDRISKTMLTGFFSTCSKSNEAKAYLYSEFPEHYVWDTKYREWNPRKKKDVIGRINGVNPTEGERYYLRLLLNHVRGPTSFADLLTVQGTRYLTFKESAQKRGLLESDNSILECLDEATTFQMPNALRRLFATILVYCEPTDVRKLWLTYFDAMSEDYEREMNISQNQKISKTLKSINSFLDSMGKSIESFDLPTIPLDNSDEGDNYSRELRDELSVEIPKDDLTAEFKLNTEQQHAFSIILDRVKRETSDFFS